MTTNKIELIFIGDKFYWESGTSMSSLYLKKGNDYLRYDWGFVQVALSEGNEVNIRPATDSEFRYFQNKLDAMKRENGNAR